VGFHVFVDYAKPDDPSFAGTIGFLKTWHDGAPDRDAIMARFNAAPAKGVWLYGSCTLDLYGEGSVKGAGVELTESWLQARYSPDPGSGVAVSYSRYTWPDLKRWEFLPRPIELIQEGRIDRFEVSGWFEVVEDVRLTGRVNHFIDHRGDGTGGQVDADWTDAFDLPLALHADLFRTEGSYLEGNGFRVEARPGSAEVQGFIGYELFQYTTTGSIGGSDGFTRHTIRAGISWQTGNWYYSLTGDRYFGDAEDAYSLGLFAEYRF
jgi:hypothetical protein